MKNKKIVLIILLNIVLILGVTTFGTAWFTLKADITSNLILNTGNVDVKVEKSRWILQNKDASEVTNKDSENNFNNVKPGDSFIKSITFKNTGSLKHALSFQVDENLPDNFKSMFKISRRNQIPIVLEPNQSKEINIAKLTLLRDAVSNTMQNDNINFSSIDTSKFIQVKAIQINAPKDHIIRFTGFSNMLITDLKFDFLEGVIKGTSTTNQAHYGFGNDEYVSLEIKDYKGNSKIKLAIKGTETGNKFIDSLKNFKFSTGDKIYIYAQELNRILISKDNGNNFKHFSNIGGHVSTKILKVTGRGLEEIN